MNSLQFKVNFDQLIRNSKNILITSHQNPDEDSIASVLLIYRYLVEILKVRVDVDICYTGEQIYSWNFNKHFEKISFVSDISEVVDNYSTIIVVDTPSFGKASEYPEKINEFSSIKILIDHHIKELDVNWNLEYVNEAPSNSENIYEIFYKNIPDLDKDLIITMLFGVLGDTKCLKTITSNDTNTLLVIKELLEKHGAISIESIYQMYERYTSNEYKIASKILDNITVREINGWPAFAYATLDETLMQDFTRNEIQRGGFLAKELLKSVKDTNWCFYIKKSRKDNLISVSFRSIIGSVDVAKIASDLNIGGGHSLSAGARFTESVDTIDQALRIISDYLENNKPVFVD